MKLFDSVVFQLLRVKLDVKGIRTMAGKYQVIEKGVANSKDYRVFFSKWLNEYKI